jgi:hypothetical protein
MKIQHRNIIKVMRDKNQIHQHFTSSFRFVFAKKSQLQTYIEEKSCAKHFYWLQLTKQYSLQKLVKLLWERENLGTLSMDWYNSPHPSQQVVTWMCLESFGPWMRENRCKNILRKIRQRPLTPTQRRSNQSNVS